MPGVLVDRVKTCICCDPWIGACTKAGESKAAMKKARQRELEAWKKRERVERAAKKEEMKRLGTRH
jgi:hypothetical protein